MHDLLDLADRVGEGRRYDVIFAATDARLRFFQVGANRPEPDQ